jgi:hypothetical protein
MSRDRHRNENRTRVFGSNAHTIEGLDRQAVAGAAAPPQMAQDMDKNWK